MSNKSASLIHNIENIVQLLEGWRLDREEEEKEEEEELWLQKSVVAFSQFRKV